MLQSLWNLISGIFESIWGLISAIFIFGFDTLSWLHFEAPRLEGLIVGILLAWFLSRRESHPIIKVISAPLKLVLDILDLAWDQGIETAGDILESGSSALFGGLGWAKSKIKDGYNFIMKKLNIAKDNLEE